MSSPPPPPPPDTVQNRVQVEYDEEKQKTRATNVVGGCDESEIEVEPSRAREPALLLKLSLLLYA